MLQNNQKSSNLTSVESEIEETAALGVDIDAHGVDANGSLMGVTAHKWEEFVPLYQKHASTVGFNIRKSTTRTENGVVIEKYLVCSCSSKPPNPDESVIKRKRNDTRTGCKANLRIQLVNGVYKVVRHNMHHNHPLTSLDWQHLHHVEKNISKQKGEAMKVMDEAGSNQLMFTAPVAAGGIAPAITLTGDALKHLNKMRTEKNEDLFLRIGVKQGGCSGISYTMEYESKEKARPGDSVMEYKGFVLVCDPKSLLFLSGMQLDYSDALIGGGFNFKNPSATQTCNCGKSFAAEI